MRVEGAFGLTSRLVALSGLAALLFTREAPDWLVVPAMLLVLAGIAYPGGLPLRPLPNKSLSVLVVVALVFSVFDFIYIGGSLIVAGADFLVILLCLKLLSLKEDKDYVQLFTISFFLLLASSGLSTDVYFLIAFTAFFVSLTWALMLLTIRGEAGRAGRAGREVELWKVGRGFFLGTAGLTLASFAATLVIFFSMPRVGMGFFNRRAGGLLKTSGFSDTVELGSMGGVKLDPTAVMRVEITGPRAATELRPYLRGRAFDFYTGDSWKDTVAGRYEPSRDQAGAFYLPRGGEPPREAPPDAIVQNITLEPLDTNTIFALYPAYKVTADFRGMWVDSSGGLHLPYPPGNRVHYTVYSKPVLPTASELSSEGAGTPAGPAAAYLQLPDGAGRLTDLAVEVAAGARSRYEKAARIREYLKSNYAYTLDPPRDLGQSPMDDFLFKARSGYCEHFATAMTLMLRAVGVPARMVSGFAGGEWNEYGGFYLVREQDAHTWVEVYFPKSGWAPFDPTPPSVSEGKPLPIISGIGRMLDFVRYKWDRYIVYYTLRDQLAAAGKAADTYRSVRLWVVGMAASIKEELTRTAVEGKAAGPTHARHVILVIPIVLAILLFIGYLALKALNAGRLGRKGSGVWFYDEMVGVLKKKGIVRPPGVTPLEFAKSASQRGGVYKVLTYVTELYNRVRFGGRPISRDEKARVRKVIEGLKRAR